MRQGTFLHAAILVSAALVAACQSPTPKGAAGVAADSIRTDSIARARQDSINRAQPGYVVDSIFTTDEELRRFRAAVGGDSAIAFVGGSPSREALVRRFLKALAANDTADIRAMVIHAREFSDLYYLDSPYSRPPYRQSVSLAWRLIQDPSLTNISTLLAKRGGQPISYVSDACDPKVEHEGKTTRYTGCLVTVRENGGKPVNRRLFGSIVERGGQFKFLSYTNKN
jgi:hypothetical protein